jgi:serine/threonine-protein kinase
VPDVPPPIAAVVMRALEKDPERRQDSAAQLATELREAYRAADGATSRLSTQVIPDADFVLKALSQNRNSQEAELRNLTPVPTNERAPISRGAASTVVSSAPVATGENKINASFQAAAPAGLPKPLLAIIALLALGGIALLAWMLLRPTTTITTQPPQRPIPPGILIPENMVQISGGTFTMGRQDGDEDERPTRSVQVKSFYLDKYEVTNQDYKKFVDATGRAAPSHWKNGSPAIMPRGPGNVCPLKPSGNMPPAAARIISIPGAGSGKKALPMSIRLKTNRLRSLVLRMTATKPEFSTWQATSANGSWTLSAFMMVVR